MTKRQVTDQYQPDFGPDCQLTSDAFWRVHDIAGQTVSELGLGTQVVGRLSLRKAEGRQFDPAPDHHHLQARHRPSHLRERRK